ncbi:MAG: hypothetical protein ABI947_08020 [Chloroflexota bacterium]
MPETRLGVALEDIRAQSGFEAALLIDRTGSVLASTHAPESSPESLEVLLQVALHAAGRAESGKSVAGESEFFDWESRRVVCRWFQARKPGVLVVLVPKGKSYKWAVNRLVRELQRLIGTA